MLIVGRFPNKCCVRFVAIVSMGDGCALGKHFDVGNLHKLTDPLLRVGVAGLEEESTENFTAGDRH